MLEMSSLLDIPYETMRRRFQDLKSKGISISPMISPESLGLKRFRVFFKSAGQHDRSRRRSSEACTSSRVSITTGETL